LVSSAVGDATCAWGAGDLGLEGRAFPGGTAPRPSRTSWPLAEELFLLQEAGGREVADVPDALDRLHPADELVGLVTARALRRANADGRRALRAELRRGGCGGRG
jgi:CBS domain-containing protein